MNNLHPTSQQFLNKICEIYNCTGKTEISEDEIVFSTNARTFFEQLQDENYIEYHYTVAPYMVLTPKTIEYAKSLKD